METYPPEIERQMQWYYQSLSEKDCRRYAAIEAVKLGYGGITYISKLLGCNYRTIALGIDELNDEGAMSIPRIRRSGGGRKEALTIIEGIDEAFLKVVQQHTAGSPMDETIKWTNLTRQQIADLLKEEGINVTCISHKLERGEQRSRGAEEQRSRGTEGKYISPAPQRPSTPAQVLTDVVRNPG